MPVEIKLPTVLRAQADGQATVAVDGATVGEVFTALVERYPGLRGNLLDDAGGLHKFVNVYKNDDDIRYLDAARHQGRRRRRRSRSSPRSPAADVSACRSYDDVLGLIGNTPLVGVHAALAEPRRPHLRQARGPEPGRLVEGPHRARR